MSKKIDVLANMVTLLGNLQKRLSKVGLQTSQTADGLAALRDETRLKVGQLQERTSGMQAELDRAWQLNNSRAEVVKKLAADTTASLNQLKDSTQRGFDGVRLDMEKALRAIQSLNARCSELESRILRLEQTNAQLAEAGRAYTADVQRFEKVRAALREAFGE